ncbi:MAG TPA: alkaline phosphatase family protein, partial [Thermoanaerobaculia bacterium]|nr:alkaline phosphatase family protein [Thermoanaerobaculia bacterium]
MTNHEAMDDLAGSLRSAALPTAQGTRRSRGHGAKLLALLAVAVVVFGCRAPSIAHDLGTRMVVIGIDSADWKIIDHLADEGKMKNLMALRKRGVWGRHLTLESIPLSPVVWTTIATGKTPEQHGIGWFMVDQPNGTRVPVRSYNRKVKALWNILAEYHRRADVLGWWATFPAEHIGKGVIVSDAMGFHGFGASARGGDNTEKTYPSSLYSELAPLMPKEEDVSYDFASRFLH